MKKVVSGLIALAIIFLAVYSFYKGNTILGIISLVVLVLFGVYLLGKSEVDKEAAGDTPKEDREKNPASTLDAEFGQAKKVREKMLENSMQDDCSLEINAAAGLVLNKDFEGSISAYERIMEKYPESRGTCIGEIGVSQFFLGNYEKALENYIEAKELGENPEYNIWELCEVLYKEKNDRTFIEKYISLYPNGQFTKKANKLLA